MAYFVQIVNLADGSEDEVYEAMSLGNAQHAADMAVNEGWCEHGLAEYAWVADERGFPVHEAKSPCLPNWMAA